MDKAVSTFIKFFFILFLALCCAFLGMVLSKFFIPKSAGLAGGAMVLGYGLLGLFVGIVLGFILKNRLSRSSINITTSFLAILGLGSLIWFYGKFRASQLESHRQIDEMTEFQRTHKPTSQAQPISENLEAQSYGYGMAKPHLIANTILYFYDSPFKSNEQSAVDSIIFTKSAHSDIDISKQPTWLRPAHLKLDYQIFHFRVFSRSSDRVEMQVNEETKKRYWVNKDQIELLSWPDFLKNVFSVEPLDANSNPVKTKPSNTAERINGFNNQTILQPRTILDDWIEVELMNEGNNKKGRGWIRWRSDSTLLIKYSLLS